LVSMYSVLQGLKFLAERVGFCVNCANPSKNNVFLGVLFKGWCWKGF
jgi:hypothetical protein